jgi:hypothetical protein
MVDYQKVTGKTGLMMIRDTGSIIEFWFKAGYSSDWANSLDFNWTANGSTTHKAISYSTGANWAKVGSVNVTDSQTIIFRLLDATGTQGMGGPTTFNQWINRASAPTEPSAPSVGTITSNSIFLWFGDAGDGGSPIDARQIGYSTDTDATRWTADTNPDGTTWVGGLNSGVTYYFRARTHNAQGWSSWSSRTSGITTLRVPDPPTTPRLSNVSTTSITVSFNANWDGGSTILSYEIGYGTNPSDIHWTTGSNGSTTIGLLAPGQVWYFWARARNSVGWSSWSSYNSAKTVAGGYIKDGSSWRLAIPYVKVGGEWRIAEPWIRSAGIWKRTS